MNKTDLNNASKFLALILRHKPEVIGATLDEHGWADVDEVVKGVQQNFLDFKREDLDYIIETDNKQRYSYNEDHTLIRANQGHSISVDVELEEANPPDYLYHGTGEKYCESIDMNGLISKSRLYVHLSEDSYIAEEVGKRHGVPVIYMISAWRMVEDGYKFYRSKNGVWLTKEVPVKYLVCKMQLNNKEGETHE